MASVIAPSFTQLPKRSRLLLGSVAALIIAGTAIGGVAVFGPGAPFGRISGDAKTAQGGAGISVKLQSDLHISDAITRREQEVTPVITKALADTKKKGYLVEVNVYATETGVTLPTSDLFNLIGPGNTPAEAMADSLKGPAIRAGKSGSAPGTLRDAKKSEYRFYELAADGSLVQASRMPFTALDDIKAKSAADAEAATSAARAAEHARSAAQSSEGRGGDGGRVSGGSSGGGTATSGGGDYGDVSVGGRSEGGFSDDSGHGGEKITPSH